MLIFAADWETVSSLATGAGTLVLAIATFASVRSANRSARIAEIALQEQRRPMLAPSHSEDRVQKLMFGDGFWISVNGGHANAQHINDSVYLAISLRNVGSGIGVCQGWAVRTGTTSRDGHQQAFQRQSRDLYVPAGDIGMWQGALRDPDDPVRAEVAAAIDAREQISIELLYSDQIGRQRTITRFGLIPVGDDGWISSMSRHWYLDWQGPRPANDASHHPDPVMLDHPLAAAGQAPQEP